MRGEQFSKSRQTQEQNEESGLKQNNSNMIPKFCFLVSLDHQLELTETRGSKHVTYMPQQSRQILIINNITFILQSENLSKLSTDYIPIRQVLSTDQNLQINQNTQLFLFRITVFSLKKKKSRPRSRNLLTLLLTIISGTLDYKKVVAFSSILFALQQVFFMKINDALNNKL